MQQVPNALLAPDVVLARPVVCRFKRGFHHGEDEADMC